MINHFKGNQGRHQKDFALYQGYEAFIYLWYDSNSKMYYLGSHVGLVSDAYAHSSQVMQPFSTRKIPMGFRRRILKVGRKASIPLMETEIIRKYRLDKNPRYYNRSIKLPDATDRIRSHTARENYKMATLRRKYPELEGAWSQYLDVLKEVRKQEGIFKRLKTSGRRKQCLTSEQVAYIRSKPCHYSVQKQLAQELNCTWSRIWSVQTGRSFSWLPMNKNVNNARYQKTQYNGKFLKTID